MDNQNVLNEVNGSIKTQESVSNSVSTKNSSVQLGSQLILTSKENACAQPTIDSKSGDSIKTIGKITYNRSILLGKGAGTFVYQGTYDNRKEKAIKKIHCEDKLDTQRRMKEVDILLKLDNNQNVVKYFGTEHDDDFLYIALEQFNGTLQQWMDEEISKIPKESITLLDTLKQSTQVLAYLHKNNIIHRDLKPENILLRVSASGIQVKLADFGISKVVPDGRNTVTQTRHIGTKGWKAPEILMFGNVEKPQMSSETDIFSLGCIFYYVLSNGKHPFGIDSNSREVHIKEEKSFLAADDLPILLQGNLLLIEEMIKTDRKKRPNVHDVLAHHIFWPVSKTWDFLLDMGDLMAKLEAENQKTRSEDVVIVALKRRYRMSGFYIYPQEIQLWTQHISLDQHVYEYIKQIGQDLNFDYSIWGILKAIQLIDANYEVDVPPNVKSTFRRTPNIHLQYWLLKFPFLVAILWTLVQMIGNSNKIKKYYCTKFIFRAVLLSRIQNCILPSEATLELVYENFAKKRKIQHSENSSLEVESRSIQDEKGDNSLENKRVK